MMNDRLDEIERNKQERISLFSQMVEVSIKYGIECLNLLNFKRF